jgi:hypothetical protein
MGKPLLSISVPEEPEEEGDELTAVAGADL